MYLKAPQETYATLDGYSEAEDSRYIDGSVKRISLQEYADDTFYNTPKTSEDFELEGVSGTKADGTTHKYTDTEMRKLHSMMSKWSNDGLTASRIIDNFNRFYQVFPEMEMTADLKSYIFITRPDLNLFGDQAGTGFSLKIPSSVNLAADNVNDPRLQYMASLNPEILYMLTKNGDERHDFMSYFSSRAESMQLTDYNIENAQFTVPFYGYHFSYPTITNKSEAGGSFDITFREDSELRVTKAFNFWIYYMDAIAKNKMKQSATNRRDNFYDYMTSIYEIICDPTSERILFWAKYTGCYPTSVPNNNLSHNVRSDVSNKISISFNYMRLEHSEPMVLADFNVNAHATDHAKESYVDIYNLDMGLTGDSIVGIPAIVPSSNYKELYLRWHPYADGATTTLASSVPNLKNINETLNNASRQRSVMMQYIDKNDIKVGYKQYVGSTGLQQQLKFNSDRIASGRSAYN